MTPSVREAKSPLASAVLSAPTTPHHPRTKTSQELRDPRETLAPAAQGDPQAPLDEMASLEILDFPGLPDPLDPLDPLALEETSLPKCLMAMMKNQLECPCLAPWVPLVLVVSLAPLAHLVPKVSKAPLVSPASLELQVPWVPEVPLAPLARTEMMVKLANLVVLVSVDLLGLRVLVDCLEQLASLE